MCCFPLTNFTTRTPVTYCPHTEAEIKWPTFYRRYFQIHFLHGICLILIDISLKSVPKGPINSKPALAQVMVCRRAGSTRKHTTCHP